MPTKRPTRFSPTSENEETTGCDGRKGRRSMSGVSSAHFVRLMEERGQTGFWTQDFLAGEFTASLGFYRLLGVHPNIPLSIDDLMKLMHPDDQPSQDDMYETMKTGHAIEREFRVIRPDGTLRWLQNKAEVIADAKGLPALAVGMIVDVTDQHAARQAVQEGWFRYKTLFQAMAVMEFRSLSNGEIVSWAGWDDLTGQTKLESVNWGWLDAIHADDREATRSAWIASLATGSTYAADYRIRCKDGRYRWFLARAAPVIDLNGSIREWIGALIQTKEYRPDSQNDPEQPFNTLKAGHIRAARAFLNWTIEDLASQAGVSVSSVRRAEAGSAVRDHLLKALREAFERHGILFRDSSKAEISIYFQSADRSLS